MKENKFTIFVKNNKLLFFVIVTLIVSLIVIPIIFNFLFIWDSGLARGKTSDWFTLYGNIMGGLFGGFFTFIALRISINNEKEKEMIIDKQNNLRFLVNFIVKNKSFIDGLNSYILMIRNITDSSYNDYLCSIGTEIDFRSSSFRENGYLLDANKIDIIKYKEILIRLKISATDYEDYLSNHLSSFNGNEKLFNKTLDFLLTIKMIADNVERSLEDEYYKDLDFFLNFINFDIGFSAALDIIDTQINEMWEKYIKDEHYGNILRSVELPHVKQ